MIIRLKQKLENIYQKVYTEIKVVTTYGQIRLIWDANWKCLRSSEGFFFPTALRSNRNRKILASMRRTFLRLTKSFPMKFWVLDSLASFMVECIGQVDMQWLSRYYYMQMKAAAQRVGERPDYSTMYIVGHHHGVATFKDFEGGKCTLCRHMVEKAKAPNIPQNVILRRKVCMFEEGSSLKQIFIPRISLYFLNF